MGIGTSLFLIATGAVLNFAVDDRVSGVELATVGLILMIVGAAGLLLSLLVLDRHRDADAVAVRDRDRVVERERHV